MKLFLFGLLFPMFAFSTDLSGTTWYFSEVGCRDRSLRRSSQIQPRSVHGWYEDLSVEFHGDGTGPWLLSGTETIISTHPRANGFQKYLTWNGTVETSHNPHGGRYIQEGDTLVFFAEHIVSIENCCPLHYVDMYHRQKKEKRFLSGVRELRSKIAEECPFVYVLRQGY